MEEKGNTKGVDMIMECSCIKTDLNNPDEEAEVTEGRIIIEDSHYTLSIRDMKSNIMLTVGMPDAMEVMARYIHQFVEEKKDGE